MTLELAVVTGGGAGLGKIIVDRLAGQGSHVVIADLDPLRGRWWPMKSNRGAAEPHLFRRTCPGKGCHRLIRRVAGLGPLSVLVNNAGGWRPGPQFPDTKDWSRSLDLNLRMPMLATQLALTLLGPGGAVVNISNRLTLRW